MNIKPGIILIVVCAFVALSMGSAVIVVTGKDPTSYAGSIGVLLTAVAAFIVTLRGQQKQSEKLEVVRKQTNGNLTKLQVEKALVEHQLRQALAKLNHADATDILDQTLSHDEVMKIVSERNENVANTSESTVSA